MAAFWELLHPAVELSERLLLVLQWAWLLYLLHHVRQSQTIGWQHTTVPMKQTHMVILWFMCFKCFTVFLHLLHMHTQQHRNTICYSYLCINTVFIPKARAIAQACWPPAPPKHASTCWDVSWPLACEGMRGGWRKRDIEKKSMTINVFKCLAHLTDETPKACGASLIRNKKKQSRGKGFNSKFTCVRALIGRHIASFATRMKPMATSSTLIAVLMFGSVLLCEWWVPFAPTFKWTHKKSYAFQSCLILSYIIIKTLKL